MTGHLQPASSELRRLGTRLGGGGRLRQAVGWRTAAVWLLSAVGIWFLARLWLPFPRYLAADPAAAAGLAAIPPAPQQNGLAATGVPTTTMAYLPLASKRLPEKIAFEATRDGNYEVYLMNPDGTGQINLTNHPAKDTTPAWSPDGRRIAFVSDRDGNQEIYVCQRDGSQVARLTFDPGADDWPAWSPDGQWIVFQYLPPGSEEGPGDLYLMRGDGSQRTRLTFDPGSERWPDWSPDGSWIAFTSDRMIYKKIYRIRPDGSGLTLVSEPAPPAYYDDRYSTWAPDGQITFVSNRPAPSDGSRDVEIYLMGADGSNVRQLTDNSAGDWLARWSPDGTRFVFYTNRDGYQDLNKEIYVKVLATGAEIRLTENESPDEYPVWSP